MNDLRWARLLIGASLVLLAIASALALVTTLDPDTDLLGWVILAIIGSSAIALIGVSATLRWQNRALTSIVERLSGYTEAERETFATQSDIAEFVRVVDSRLVGFLESIHEPGDEKAD